MKTKTPKLDTSCKKCGAEMPPLPPSLAREFRVTNYVCKVCRHHNDLRKRKGYEK